MTVQPVCVPLTTASPASRKLTGSRGTEIARDRASNARPISQQKHVLMIRESSTPTVIVMEKDVSETGTDLAGDSLQQPPADYLHEGDSKAEQQQVDEVHEDDDEEDEDWFVRGSDGLINGPFPRSHLAVLARGKAAKASSVRCGEHGDFM